MATLVMVVIMVVMLIEKKKIIIIMVMMVKLMLLTMMSILTVVMMVVMMTTVTTNSELHTLRAIASLASPQRPMKAQRSRAMPPPACWQSRPTTGLRVYGLGPTLFVVLV